MTTRTVFSIRFDSWMPGAGSRGRISKTPTICPTATSPAAGNARYSIDAGPLKEVDAWLDRFRAFWEPKLDALATEVARGKRARRGS